jgi:glycosyltransferase involved in cell wall biosynthesis
MPSPVATVVIPTFNRADLLPDAINSVLAQTVHCEIIIVDHGSTDSTPRDVLQWGDNVVYVRRETDSGPQFSWLDGVLMSSCEFVKILPDDDWLEPTFMERCLSLMSPRVGFVSTAATVTDMNKTPINTLFSSLFSESGVKKSRRDRDLVAQTMISPTALLLRKQELIDGIYVGRLPFQIGTYHGAGADHFLKLLSLLRYPEFGFIQEPLANFRSHPGSITVNAIESGKKSPLTQVYTEVLQYYRLLDFAERTHLMAAVSGLHSVRRKVARVPAFIVRYIRQVKRAGMVPLRFQKGSR